jgi:hypothetical protein
MKQLDDIYLYKEKMEEVYQWRHGVFSRDRDEDKMVERREEDFARLNRTPAEGGIQASLRAYPYFFGVEPLPEL